MIHVRPQIDVVVYDNNGRPASIHELAPTARGLKMAVK
jgi:hypothetical protein